MFLKEVTLSNILSFGSQTTLGMKRLNVLIGPNGCGKSNFIEALGLLRAAPTDIRIPIRECGGVENWLWRGKPRPSSARLEIVVDNPRGQQPLRYSLEFWASDGRFELKSDLERCPEIRCLERQLGKMRLYREWALGRNAAPRLPPKPNLPDDFLMENGSNLALVLGRLALDKEAKQAVLRALHQLYDGISDFRVDVQDDTVQLFLQERDTMIPATRLPDGTLRYLCLLTVLCNSDPPPLVCLEGPELGLHPDVLPQLADLLRDASQRCQLVVTTHSDTLVDALTEDADAVVVCEKHDGKTTMERLNRERLSHSLKKYSLGQLWSSGEIGGNRW